MSEWYEEAKKPMAGKLGDAIEKLCKNEIVCPTSVIGFAEELAKKHKVKKEFLISEIGRHHDFHNGWSNDSKYLHYTDNKDKCELESVYPPKDDHNWHWSQEKITNQKEMTAWIVGYKTASSNCYDRFNKLMVLLTMYLEQENGKNN